MRRVKFASICQVVVASPGTATPSEPPRRLCLTFARQQAKKSCISSAGWSVYYYNRVGGLTEGEMTEGWEQWGRKERRENGRMNRREREKRERARASSWALRGVDREDGAMAAVASQCVSSVSPLHPQVCQFADPKKNQNKTKGERKEVTRQKRAGDSMLLVCANFSCPLCLHPLRLHSPLPRPPSPVHPSPPALPRSAVD